MDSTNRERIDDWVWCNKDSENDKFAFDSEAEGDWANLLSKLAAREAAEVEQIADDTRFLWGKNYPFNSEIKYEYYNDGIHKSYPDFVMKDTQGRIHIFEVKSLNGDGSAGFDVEEYEAKINLLKDCYKAASAKINNHIFYIPIRDGDTWKIFRYCDGEEEIMTVQQLRSSFRES